MKHSPRFFRQGLLALTLGLAAAQAGAAELVALELALDNDQFAATPARDERGYTSGAFLRAAFDHTGQMPPACRIGLQPACDGAARHLWVFSLEHALYTPADTAAPVGAATDRPYAATLALGARSVTTSRSHRTELGLRLGTLGPAAQGEAVQNGLHRLIGQARAQGWSGQVRAQALAEAEAALLVAAALPGNSLDTVGRVALRVGTPETSITLGGLVRWGAHAIDPTWPGASIGALEPPGWSALAGGEVQGVLRDARIDDAPGVSGSQVRHAPLQGRVFAGLGYGFTPDLRLEFLLALHAVPFTVPEGAPEPRPQRIGTLALRWTPQN